MISQYYQILFVFPHKNDKKNPKAFDRLWDGMNGKVIRTEN